MTNRARGEVSIALSNGSKLPLRVTWEVLGNLQDDLNCESVDGILELMIAAVNGKGNVRVVNTVFHRMLEGANGQITRAEVNELELSEPLGLPAKLIEAFIASGFAGDVKPTAEDPAIGEGEAIRSEPKKLNGQMISGNPY